MENLNLLHPLAERSITFMHILSSAESIACHRQARPRFVKVLISLLLLTESVFAQDNVKKLLLIEPDKTVYTTVEKQPEFPGGRRAMENYLLTTARYPAEAQKAGVKGRVFVSFIVETDGRITGVELLKSLGFGCDEEAIRVINAMPRWTPGSQSGKPLRVRHHVPVLFGLDYPKRKDE